MGFIDTSLDFISSLNGFRDTIFLKDDSSLEKQINELKELRDKIKDNREIDKDIKLLELGLQGEKEIDYELKNANLGMYVLHDVNIVYEDYKAQIDFVIVTKAHTYLVECKNLIGDITIDSNGNFKREYVLDGRKIKEGIYSPYTQALRHRDIIKKRWVAKNSKLTVAFHGKHFDDLYKPIVVLANSKGILNNRYAPKEIRQNTIRVDQLVSFLKKDIENYDKDLYSSKKQMESIAESFLNIHVEIGSSLVYKYKKMIENNNELVCPKCKGKLVLRSGPYGKFYGCSNYPKCNYIKKF